MKKSKFNIGDLVVISNAETDFKAHNQMMAGKLGLIIQDKKEETFMDIWYVLVEDIVVPVMGKHLKRARLYDKE